MGLKSYQCVSHVLGLVALAGVASAAWADPIFEQKNLVSDILGLAPVTDANLVNPWGIDWGDTGQGKTPFWISDNGTGKSTVYNGTGQPFPPQGPLIVTIPPPSGAPSPSAPTGLVFSGGTHFAPDSSGARPLFLFATEDGTVAGWGGSNAVLRVDSSKSVGGAIYKGLAISNSASTSTLYTTNFHTGAIDTFDANFVRTTLAGNFADPNLPAGYAPFNIENIGDQLYVTYAKQDANMEDDVAGAGNGFIDIFKTDGTLVTRLASRGSLNSPWGMAIAPSSFGQFAGKLLVGNFGDGAISVFDPVTGQFLGQLKDKNGDVIHILGLWGLKVGGGGNAGDPNALFFTAGLPDATGELEQHGLFGELSVVPEANTSLVLLAGLGLVAALRFRRRSTVDERPA